jgi:hypothetical protein
LLFLVLLLVLVFGVLIIISAAVAPQNALLEAAFGPQHLSEAHAVLGLVLGAEVAAAIASRRVRRVLLGARNALLRVRRALLSAGRVRGSRVQTLSELLALTPSRFEAAMCQLLADLGYKDVRHTGKAGDLAADVVCRNAQGQSVIVQCKRYAREQKVTSPEIQTFIGMAYMHHRAGQAIFITTAGFTEPAINLARQHQIRLIDGDELGRLVVKVQQTTIEPIV